MIDDNVQNVLERKILVLLGYLEELKSYVNLSDEVIRHNKDKLYSMERMFQLVVDEAVDINAILAYHLGGKIPDSLKSSFFEIVPLKIIDYYFAEKISESAKTRNQVTYDYDKLTTAEVISSIRKFSEMYETYAKILVEKFINK